MSYVETGIHLAKMFAECQTQNAEDQIRHHMQIMLNRAQELRAENTRLRDQRDRLKNLVLRLTPLTYELAHEVGAILAEIEREKK